MSFRLLASVVATAALLGLSAPAVAADAAKPADGKAMPMHSGKAMHGPRHHKSCYDAAYQSQEWKDCEARMMKMQDKKR